MKVVVDSFRLWLFCNLNINERRLVTGSGGQINPTLSYPTVPSYWKFFNKKIFEIFKSIVKIMNRCLSMVSVEREPDDQFCHELF